MANNPYVNKVVYGSNTLIDISDTTATASDVASGKYFYTAAGQKVQGSATAGSIVVSDTTDTHGGTIRTITTGQTVNLQTKTITPTSSQQTINPDSGYNGFSQVIVEASSGGGGSVTQDANGYIILPPTGGSSSPTLITKTITQNGTYLASADNADGFSAVSINVSATVNIDIKTSYESSTASMESIQYSNLLSRPKAFFLQLYYVPTASSSAFGSYILDLCFDGTNTTGVYWSQNNGSLSRSTSYYTWTYSEPFSGHGTITLNAPGYTNSGGGFYITQNRTTNYRFTYVY